MSQLLIFTVFFISSFQAFAFVENVTHGYPACIACHVSPNGGGLLTDYGRSLSNELMSTWNTGDNFSEPFFGALKNKKTLKLGGDLRTIQTRVENNNIESGKLFPMQQNIEAGVKVDRLMFVGTAGVKQGPDYVPQRGTFLSERHYVLWTPNPTSRLRAGKFRQSFGINTPNHTRLTKQEFGFGFLSEAYNVEYSHFYETYEITVGTSLGQMDTPQDPRSEKSFSTHFTYYLNENSRFGISYLLGESTIQRRNLISLNGVFPFSDDWLGLYELVYQSSHLASSSSFENKKIASFLKLGHSPLKGLMWYAFFEHVSNDTSSAYSLEHAPGLGLQWLPISHLNIQFEYLREINSTPNGNLNNNGWNNPNHTAWLLFHLYL